HAAHLVAFHVVLLVCRARRPPRLRCLRKPAGTAGRRPPPPAVRIATGAGRAGDAWPTPRAPAPAPGLRVRGVRPRPRAAGTDGSVGECARPCAAPAA